VVRRSGFRQHDDVPFEATLEDDLGRRAVVPVGDLLDDGLVEDFGAGQRRRGLDYGVGLAAVLDEIRPLEERVELDLVDRDRDVGDVVGTGQLVGREVRDADVADQALLVQCGHRVEALPQGDRRVRPVDQVQVEVVGAQPVE